MNTAYCPRCGRCERILNTVTRESRSGYAVTRKALLACAHFVTIVSRGRAA